VALSSANAAELCFENPGYHVYGVFELTVFTPLLQIRRACVFIHDRNWVWKTQILKRHEAGSSPTLRSLQHSQSTGLVKRFTDAKSNDSGPKGERSSVFTITHYAVIDRA
jgi:hypothetical protein